MVRFTSGHLEDAKKIEGLFFEAVKKTTPKLKKPKIKVYR